uniref:Response regulatory domain-containing protein n=1 Tax=Oryza meridionalis TaxID=40149 RepID=A0A0E0DCS3_9ORYZ
MGLKSNCCFSVIVYSSPVNALTILENNPQDIAVVLATVDMKQLSGLKFLEAARMKHQDLQVIKVLSIEEPAGAPTSTLSSDFNNLVVLLIQKYNQSK